MMHKLISTGLMIVVLAMSPWLAAQPKPGDSILITGANRGVGLALAKKFHAQGYEVIATARKPDQAKALKALGVRIEQLDVTSPDSVAALKRSLADKTIDILVNNAGISGHGARSLAQTDIEQFKKTLDVNSLGPLRVTQALLPNLMTSETKIVANMSSVNGSITRIFNGCCLGYNGSKAALNSYNRVLSFEFSSRDFIFVVLHPGWVKTDMTGDFATYLSLIHISEPTRPY